MNKIFLLPRATDDDLDPDALSALIGAIYDAALDPGLWLSVLEQVARFVDGAAAGLLSKDSSSKVGDIHHNYGIEEHYVRLYRDTYWRFDPLSPLAISPVGEVMGRMDLVNDGEFREGRFYREWAAPQRLIDAANVVLDKSSTSFALLSVIRSEDQGMVDARMRRRLDLIVPHLRRSVLIGRVIDLKSADGDSFDEMLDAVAAAVVLFDAEGRITRSNAAAQRLMAAGDVVVGRGARLVATDRGSNDSFRVALKAAAGHEADLGENGIAVPLRSRGGERYVAHFLPMQHRRRAAGTGAVAAVFIRRAALESRAAPELVARTFGLTPSELRVLVGIVEAGGVSDTAAALGIGEATVRTHLHRVFGKTGAARQADLVKLLAGYASPLVR